MSYHVMGLSMKAELSDRQGKPDPTAKLVLLALAFAYKDERRTARISLDKLCLRTGFRQTAVRSALDRLEDKKEGFGLISTLVKSAGRGYATVYDIDLDRLATLDPDDQLDLKLSSLAAVPGSSGERKVSSGDTFPGRKVSSGEQKVSSGDTRLHGQLCQDSQAAASAPEPLEPPENICSELAPPSHAPTVARVETNATEGAGQFAKHNAPGDRHNAAAGSAGLFSLAIYRQFVFELKERGKRIRNPDGFARFLRSSGEDDDEIVAWLAARQARASKEDDYFSLPPVEQPKPERRAEKRDHSPLWFQVLAELRTRLAAETVETWFEQINGIASSDGLVIEVPDQVFVEWIESNYREALEQALAAVGSAGEVRFEVVAA